MNLNNLINNSRNSNLFSPLTLESVLDKGKWKGKTLRHAICNNPSYAYWMWENKHWEIDEDAMNVLHAEYSLYLKEQNTRAEAWVWDVPDDLPF